jgi:type I restriction enzyme M protein
MRKDAGVDGDAQRISQMVWMLFMKIYANKEKEWSNSVKTFQSPIPENLKWDNWAVNQDLNGNDLIEFINTKLFPELKGLDNSKSDNAGIVKSVFEDTYNYMKNGILFRQVLNEIDKINLNDKKNSHVFNDIYESILKELQSAGSSGEFYTPRAVTQFVVEMVNPVLGETVLDPACGTGGFLTCAIDYIQNNSSEKQDIQILQKHIQGVEKKPLPHLLCTTNLMLHNFDCPKIQRGNLLTRPFDSWRNKDQVSIVLSNPPFGGIEEDGIEKNFPENFRTKETADLFLTLIIKILKKGGRAGVVLPDGSLGGNGVTTRIRKELLTNCNLHTVIRMPKGVFNPYTSIKTNLLFFEKGKPTEEIWYYEMPYPEGYKNFSKSRPISSNHFDKVKKWWANKEVNEFAWKVDIEQIRKNNYSLDFNNPFFNTEIESYSSTELLKQLTDSMDKSQRLIEEIKNSLI